jgi:putative tryptophan/tyrosine transport system substrate-binding protein
MNTRVVGSLVLMLIILAPGILAAPFGSDAELPRTAARIGWLSLFGDAQSPIVKAFRQGLRELGYVEGQNLLIEYRFSEGRSERLGASGSGDGQLPGDRA